MTDWADHEERNLPRHGPVGAGYDGSRAALAAAEFAAGEARQRACP